MAKERGYEIKPFGYRMRRFLLKRVLKLSCQKRVKQYSFLPEEDPGIPVEAEQVALAAYLPIEFGDDKILLIESYCKSCKCKAIRIQSSKTKRVFCVGCGKEFPDGNKSLFT